jgi:hypothetical protein
LRICSTKFESQRGLRPCASAKRPCGADACPIQSSAAAARNDSLAVLDETGPPVEKKLLASRIGGSFSLPSRAS